MKVLLQSYVENIKSCLRKNKAFTSFGRYELQKKKKSNVMIASLGRETYNWRLLADIPGGRGGEATRPL